MGLCCTKGEKLAQDPIVALCDGEEVSLSFCSSSVNLTTEHRPQHPLYEGAEPMLLCFNPMLPLLARLLVHGAFRDFRTIEELLQIVLPEGEMLQLY